MARAFAARFARKAASSVWLSGSWARGDARRGSDLDLWVFGLGAGKEMVARGGFLVSIHRYKVAVARAEQSDPRSAGQAVLAWREAVPLYDPRGVGARLQLRADRFRWSTIRPRVRRYVSRTLAEWAEEAVKLTRLQADGAVESAAAQRNCLANALAELLATHYRLLYHENGLWETVGARAGARWHSAQRQAFGLSGRDFDSSCEGALDLYRETARVVWPELRPADRAAVRLSLELIGRPLDAPGRPQRPRAA